MAITYGKNTSVDYAAGNLASFGKSYSRMGAAPLDMYEVWYDKTELEAYASNRGVEQADGSFDTSSVTSYVGQRVVFVDETNNKVYNYTIQLDGSLKEIGVAPLGDSKSISVDAETGTVSLKGIDTLTFEREIDVLDEDDQPTGEKAIEEIKYQPLMTKDGLVWIEPSKTTVEGLATLIEGLNTSLNIEVQARKDADAELAQNIADEADARADADDALSARIGYASVAGEGDEEGTPASGVYVAIEAEVARATSAEEALGKRIDDLGDVATKTYVDNAVEGEKELRETAVSDLNDLITEVSDRVEAFLTGTGTQEALDSLQELITYIDTHDDADIAGILASIQALEDKLTLGTYKEEVEGEEVDTEYKTVKAYVEAVIEALHINDYAKTADVNIALESKVNKTEIEETLDVLSQGIATAHNGFDQSIKTINETIEKMSKDADDAIGALEETIDTLNGHIADAEEHISNAEDRLLNIEDDIEEINGSITTLTNDKANASSVYTKTEIDEFNYASKDYVGEEIAKETKRTDDALKLKADATELNNAIENVNGEISKIDSRVTTNANDIDTLEGRMDTAEGKINSNTQAIAEHATEFATLAGRVDGHDSSIASLSTNKADKSVVDSLATTVGEHTTAISSLNTNKANKDEVYGKDQVYTKSETDSKITSITGTPDSGKTLVEMIADAKSKAEQDDNTIKTSVKANADAISAIYASTTDDDGKVIESGVLATKIAEVNASIASNTENIGKNAQEIAKLAEDIGNVSNIMNFRDVVESSDAGFVEDVKVITDPEKGDVIIYGEQEYVYDGKDWKLFGDASGNANAISALDSRVEAVETAVNTTLPGLISALDSRVVDVETAVKTTLPEAISEAITEAKTYADENFVKEVESTHEAIVATKDATTGKVSIGFAENLVICGGSANKPAVTE